MRYAWETCDIHAGRRVQAGNRTEVWMIGYDARTSGSNLALISLNDGMICRGDLSASDMAKHLNESGMRPVDVRTDDIANAEA